ncbi:hypothetical protein [Streptomyces sp. NBC_00199]|uniref:hypothetical protein n=1 Tax=Streptomyces sp. NBC_00199 TaxID=2975678 RepID=UPI002257812E|nr:hypothetical protein [Streptomyces sp. NBC_00199]MCX5264286.1 hypothetical protein [Streptomyces sp. NBC_00199]
MAREVRSTPADAADQRVSRGQGRQLARLGQGRHALDESQPGTAALDTLLERVRAAGPAAATLHTAGDLAALPTASSRPSTGPP